MKFIVDAQLPRRLVIYLRRLGYDAQHTWGLESGNRTPDNRVAQIADHDDAIVITKDADFLNSHILNGSPKKLLLISTGNISNPVLLKLFEQHINLISSALKDSNLVELNQQGLVAHES